MRGIDRTFETDAEGVYAAAGLPFGRYKVELSKSGFAIETVAIDLQAAAAVTRAITMELSRAAFDVDVISTTPLPGVELSRDEIPAAVQALTQSDLANSGALDLSDFLNRRLNGVNVNEVQGNPYQPHGAGCALLLGMNRACRRAFRPPTFKPRGVTARWTADSATSATTAKAATTIAAPRRPASP